MHLSLRVCPMAIFKNSYKKTGYESKRFWTFVYNDCLNEGEFYLDQTWIDVGDIEFACICKSKCKNYDATKTDTI